MFSDQKSPVPERAINMYKRIADKITKFVLATVKKEMFLEMAVNGK